MKPAERFASPGVSDPKRPSQHETPLYVLVLHQSQNINVGPMYLLPGYVCITVIQIKKIVVVVHANATSFQDGHMASNQNERQWLHLVQK